MSTPYFAEGNYECIITAQSFVRSSRKDTPGFRLVFRVIRSLDSDEVYQPYMRDATLWLGDDDSQDRAMDTLRKKFGYDRPDFLDLDPNRSANFFDLRDRTCTITCKHRAYKKEDKDGQWVDTVGESWGFDSGMPELAPTALQKLNARYRSRHPASEDGAAVATVGAKDEDIPF
jgi:hypothetical protein